MARNDTINVSFLTSDVTIQYGCGDYSGVSKVIFLNVKLKYSLQKYPNYENSVFYFKALYRVIYLLTYKIINTFK